MRLPLPLPDPRGAVELLGELASVVPRALLLLESGEALLRRADELITRIDQTRANADEVVERTSRVVSDANTLIIRTAGTVGSVEPTIHRAEALIDSFAPALEKLQPTLDRLAETTSPAEVDALVALIDHLPMLVDKLETDIIPIMENMRTVGPDIHAMLDTVEGLNDMISKIPGMGRLRQKADEED